MNNANKVRRLSSIMTRCCEICIIVLPLSVIWFWLNIDQNISSLSIAKPTVLLDMQYIQSYQIILGWLISMTTTIVLLYGLWHIRLLFKHFNTGIFFSQEVARHLYIFSLTLFVSALLKPISTALLSLLLTMGNPYGEKSLVIEFGAYEVSLLFIAGTLMVITWILKEGQKLVTENKEFI